MPWPRDLSPRSAALPGPGHGRAGPAPADPGGRRSAWPILILAWAAGCAGPPPVSPQPVPDPSATVAAVVDHYVESESSIDELLLQFDRGRSGDLFPLYRDLAHALAPETRLLVAVPSRDDLAAAHIVLEGAGFPRDRYELLVCHDDLTIWARDRMIPISGGRDRVFFIAPDHTVLEDRRCDLRVARTIASTRSIGLVSGLFLEGGNVLLGRDHVFVGGNAVSENEAAGDPDALPGTLAGIFRRPAVLVAGPDGQVPAAHLDMYLTLLGPDHLLLGDPGAGAEYLRQLRWAGIPDALAEWIAEASEHEQMRLVPTYEAIRAQLLRAGFRVDRIPIVHSHDGKTLTWNNALIEHRAAGRRAYVPTYGIPTLDEIALRTYRRLGFATFPIDASRIARFGGTVRCLTNVVAWSNGPRSAAVRPRVAAAAPAAAPSAVDGRHRQPGVLSPRKPVSQVRGGSPAR